MPIDLKVRVPYFSPIDSCVEFGVGGELIVMPLTKLSIHINAGEATTADAGVVIRDLDALVKLEKLTDVRAATMLCLRCGKELVHKQDNSKVWWTCECEPTKPRVKPPLDGIKLLETNRAARWPFPTLRAKKPLPRRKPEDIKYITLHHSAGSRNSSVTYWHSYHTKTKSWSRVGYHMGIAMWKPGDDIDLYELNPPWEFTWHDSRNKDTYGLCISGDLRAGYDASPNNVQLKCFGRAMAYLLPKLPGLQAIVGHKKWQRTACPGDLREWAPSLIAAAGEVGHDIRGLLDTGAARSYSFPLKAVKAVMRPSGPSRADYDEHTGLSTGHAKE